MALCTTMRVKGTCLFHNTGFKFGGSSPYRLVDEVGEVLVFWNGMAKKGIMGYGRGSPVPYLW